MVRVRGEDTNMCLLVPLLAVLTHLKSPWRHRRDGSACAAPTLPKSCVSWLWLLRPEFCGSSVSSHGRERSGRGWGGGFGARLAVGTWSHGQVHLEGRLGNGTSAQHSEEVGLATTGSLGHFQDLFFFFFDPHSPLSFFMRIKCLNLMS